MASHAQYKARRAAGLCPLCGEAHDDATIACAECRGAIRQYYAAVYAHPGPPHTPRVPEAAAREILGHKSDHQAAEALGVSISTIWRWRQRYAIPPYRPHRTLQEDILAALQPPGTWRRKQALQQLRFYDISNSLHALCRQGLVQRRGEVGAYEYALAEEG